MPKAIGFPTQYNFKNILRGLTPTFTDWVQNPGTLDQSTDEMFTVLSTNGIIAAFTTGLIVYDLGAPMRVLVTLYETGSVQIGASIDYSIDGVQYYSRAWAAATLHPSIMAVGRGQYIRFNCNKATAATISELSMCAYLV